MELIFLCHPGRLFSAGTQSRSCSTHQKARSYKTRPMPQSDSGAVEQAPERSGDSCSILSLTHPQWEESKTFKMQNDVAVSHQYKFQTHQTLTCKNTKKQRKLKVSSQLISSKERRPQEQYKQRETCSRSFQVQAGLKRGSVPGQSPNPSPSTDMLL